MEDPYTRINTGRAVMNRDKFDKILTAFSHAQKKLPACILQCKDCLSDRCELPFHEPTFHDPIDTAWSYTSSSNVTIVDNPYLNQRPTSSNQLPGQECLYPGQEGRYQGHPKHKGNEVIRHDQLQREFQKDEKLGHNGDRENEATEGPQKQCRKDKTVLLVHEHSHSLFMAQSHCSEASVFMR